MTQSRSPAGRAREQTGQALVLVLGLVAALIVGSLILAAFGQALGAKSRQQRAADLAAVSAASSMRDDYPRLFEPAVLANGLPNPRHLPLAVYLARARTAATRAVRRNGLRGGQIDVAFPGGSFAPTRVRVRLQRPVEVELGEERERPGRTVELAARAVAELSPALGAGAMPSHGSGGGYDGPLAYRQGKPMRPDVAGAFDRMAAAARSEAGIALLVTSGYRSDAEQAELFAANPDPKWVAPPGQSLHRYGTELDLGPPEAYGWLAANARRFGFVKRYEWEEWHFGYVHNPGSASVGFGAPAREGRSSLPSFVPERFREPIARAAQRWNVGAALLSAQLYAESHFNPFAVSPAGAQGIAQFMPGTAEAYGLADSFDPEAAIDAQAHLMRDLLGRFGSVPLALAAYNAGPGAVERCGCIPPYPETQAYVARILGLLGGAGDIAAAAFEVRLVE